MEKLNKILKTSEIAVIDQYTIEHEPIESIDLMERAARIFTKNLLKKFSHYRKFAVVAGWGNNGGDGYAIARLLKQAGKEAEVFCLRTGSRLSPDCELNRKRWEGTLTEITAGDAFCPDVEALIIDALFGSGLNRKVSGPVAGLIRKINALPNRVVAVDIPSGLMGEDNSANDRDAIVRADVTFTFQRPKLAFMLAENYACVGEWYVLDIGLHPEALEQTLTSYYYLTPDRVANLLPLSGKFDHKGTNGHGLLIAGSYGMMGAAILASRAAVRSGIGLLTCHVPRKGNDVLQISVPDVLVERDEKDEWFSGAGISGRYQAVAAGPGLGTHPETVAGLRKLLTEWRGLTILDADALNIISKHREMLELLHEGCILTPHPKEFERLSGKSENDFERLNKLSNFASHYGVSVVLKGAHTVIATPQGECYFNTSGNPGLAKGGSGDVLTGVLLALGANGMRPERAAMLGVFAHGLAGDLLAEEKGERGICATELAGALGKAWKELELKTKIGKI